ncbi:MAG: VIT domain-containing protein [Gemmatimonadaceae bacterium]
MQRRIRHVRHMYQAVLTLLCVPAVSWAQGRLIERCGADRPVTCGPEAGCRPPTPRPCGPSLERVSGDVRISLADRVLRYEVTEIFRNNGSRVAEADYIFPLPAGAAFEDLKLSINGELVSGETMAAERARGIYEEIVRRQRDPALVEWVGSGMLRARIFPIAPGEEKKVVVRFQSVAEREGDALRIAYRRGSDPNATAGPIRPVSFPRQDDGDDARELGEWTRISFLYEPGARYGEPYSPTHTLRTRSEGRLRLVETRGSASELMLLLPLRRADAASLNVLAHAPGGASGFVLITVTPPSGERRSTPRDLTFVVDVSGSMSGRKLQQAKAAGHALLATMRSEDRFRIVDFSTDVRSFRDGWTNATPGNLREARRYLDGLRAQGSTNISGALTEALERSPSAGRLPLVVLLTDGEPTVGERNPDAIAALAARLRGDARVFSVGVSAEVNAGLIEQLAVGGRGTAHFVRDSESVERVVSLLASRLTSPLLTNVRLRADGVRLTQMLPAGSVDVFAGQDLVLLARYDGQGTATLQLEGESSDGPVRWSTRASFPSRSRANPFVARLWAAQRLGWLAAEKRKSGGSSELDAEIRSLGETYGIPTEFTSYLVVEPGMNVAADVQGRRERAAAAPASALGNAAKSTGEARFEAARVAAEQRETRTLASLDAAVKDQTDTERRAAGRRFLLAKGVWTDARYTPAMRVVRVKAYSPAYFELARRLPGLAEGLALADRIIVAGRAVAIEVTPDGEEQLDARTLDELSRSW